jgi:hypothetical protein
MATIAQQIKKELKAAFPGIKFSCSMSNGGYSVRVEYVDGPSRLEVEAIAKKHDDSGYDFYSDCHYGSCSVYVYRTFSEQLNNEILDAMQAKGYDRECPNTYNERHHWNEAYGYFLSGETSRIDPEQRMALLAERESEAAQLAADEANDVITAEAETVIEPVQIEITPFFYSANFAKLNRNETIEEYERKCESGDYNDNEIQVVEHWTMTNEQYDSYTQRLLDGFDFIAGKGGNGSHNESMLREVEDWFDYTEAEKQIWRDGAYAIAVAISAPDRDVIVVDTQGYNYARYVGLIPNQKAIKGLLFENTITAISPAAPLQLVPADFNPRNNPTFSHEGEIVYVVKFGQVAAGIPSTWICQGMSGKRYEVGSDVVCQHIPKAA